MLTRLHRMLRSDAAGERGAAMVVVVVIMALALIIGAGVVGSNLQSMGTVSMSRAGAQSRAAAESGLSAGLLSVSGSACTPSVSGQAVGSSAERYDYAVSWRAASSGSFTPGCPSTSATQVRILATGYAGQRGLSGYGSNDTEQIEGVYPYTFTNTTVIDNSIQASGAAIYGYAGSGTIANQLSMTSANQNQVPSILYKTGNQGCTGGTSVDANVVLGGGSFTVDSSCRLNRNLVVSGSVVMLSTGTVGGDVSAGSVGGSGFAFSQSNDTNSVGGSVFANGPVSMFGTAGGAVAAGPAGGTSKFYANSSIGSNLTYAGGITADGGVSGCGSNDCSTSSGTAAALKTKPNVRGTISQSNAIPTPAAPSVPGWVDYAYDATKWTSNGFTEQVLTSSQCDFSWSGGSGTAALTAALASTRPVVLNTLACPSGISMWNYANPKLTSDLAIIANKFDIGNATFASASSAQRRLWFITPDPTADGAPTCASGTALALNGSFAVASSVNALLYTPCQLNISNITWRGQFYAGTIAFNAGITFTYAPIGLPGVNLDSGQTTWNVPQSTGQTTVTVGAPLSQRDVTG